MFSIVYLKTEAMVRRYLLGLMSALEQSYLV